MRFWNFFDFSFFSCVLMILRLGVLRIWIGLFVRLWIRLGLLLILIGDFFGFFKNFFIVIFLLILIIILYRVFSFCIDKLKIWGCVWLLIMRRFLNFFVVNNVTFLFWCLSKVFVVMVVFIWIDLILEVLIGLLWGNGVFR